MKKFLIIFTIVVLLSGCSQSTLDSYTPKKLVVYNDSTNDKVVEIVGTMKVSEYLHPWKLVCSIAVDKGAFVEKQISLSRDTAYVIEELEESNEDPYYHDITYFEKGIDCGGSSYDGES